MVPENGFGEGTGGPLALGPTHMDDRQIIQVLTTDGHLGQVLLGLGQVLIDIFLESFTYDLFQYGRIGLQAIERFDGRVVGVQPLRLHDFCLTKKKFGMITGC